MNTIGLSKLKNLGGKGFLGFDVFDYFFIKKQQKVF